MSKKKDSLTETEKGLHEQGVVVLILPFHVLERGIEISMRDPRLMELMLQSLGTGPEDEEE